MKPSRLEKEAFLLFMDSCYICGEKCSGTRESCGEPKRARPAPKAMAVDVYTTVRQIGYAIELLNEYSQAMNRYAFLVRIGSNCCHPRGV